MPGTRAKRIALQRFRQLTEVFLPCRRDDRDGSCCERFRTPASSLAQPLSLAGIRNPSHERYYNILMLRINSSSVNEHCGCRLQLDGRDRIREAMEARRAATQCGSRQRGSMDVPAPITSANAKTATASGTHPEKTQSAPRTVNALLDLLQFLGPSSARFQAVIHSLSVRFMPKSSLRCLSKSGMWAAP